MPAVKFKRTLLTLNATFFVIVGMKIIGAMPSRFLSASTITKDD